MASQARVVCWQNREEWLYVYKALYSFDDPDTQRKGLDRVVAWKSRSSGKLPLAIECTANLISAQLGLENVECDVQGRLTLAMAIVRFVNGMVDQVQKGKFARSVQSIADEIGLPDWLVDLRHEATHASLPSMDTLQCGLRVSLSWLQGEYWEAQINVHDGNAHKLSQLLNEYRLVAMSCFTTKKKNEKLKYSGGMKELSDGIVNVVSRNSLWSLLPSILCHKDMLIPSREQLNTLGIKWLPKGSFTASSNSIPDVPTEVLNMWKTLLEALDKSSSEFTTSLIIHFLENLSDAHYDQTGDLSPSYAAWIKFLLDALSSKKPPLVLTKDIPWVTVLQVALENPTSYSLTLIPLILKNIPAISADVKGKIQNLVLTFLNLDCSSADCIEESPHFDLEEVMENRRNTSLMSEQQDELTSSPNQGWEISQGNTQWHLIPFGEVLGTSDVSPTNLELSENSHHRDNGVECASGPENDIFVAHDEAVLSDCDNDDDMSIDWNSSDQQYHNTQDKEPVEMTEAAHEYNEDTEGQNDIASISNQIFLF